MESTYRAPGMMDKLLHGVAKRHVWFRDERMSVQCAICFEPRTIGEQPSEAKSSSDVE